MTTKFIKYCHIAILFTFIGGVNCNAKKKSIINVDINKIENRNLSDIAESIKLTPLITDETGVQITDVGYVYKDEGIILLQSGNSQNLFLFDVDANCIADLCKTLGHDKMSINDRGRVCTLLHRAIIDRKNEQIYMYDGQDRFATFSYSGQLLEKEFISTINENTDYILFELKLKPLE